jgi:MFS family permease
MQSSIPASHDRRLDAYPDRQPPSGRRGVALVVGALVCATFGEGVLLGLVPAAIPGIGALFGTSAGDLTWVNTMQLLSTAVCTPVIARLGDMCGHRRLLRVAVLLALLGAIACAAAPDFGVLLAGRVLEGTVASFTALAFGIVRDRLPMRGQRVAMTSITAGLLSGSAVGLVVAAEVFRASGNTRTVLWIPVAFFAVSLVPLLTVVPESRRRARVRLDWLGALTLSAWLVMLLIAAAEGSSWGWRSSLTIGAITAALLLLAAWIGTELTVREPMVDLRVAARRRIAPIYLASVTLGAAFFGAQAATSSFLASPRRLLGYGFALGLTDLALVLLPGSVAAVLGALVVAPAARRWGHKVTLCTGCTAMAIGYGAVALWHGTLGEFIAALCLTNLGTGIVTAGLPVVAAERAQRTATGIGTGLFNTAKGVGGSIAGAAFAAVLTALSIARTHVPRESAYVVVWIVCGGCALVSLLIIITVTGRSADTAPPVVDEGRADAD